MKITIELLERLYDKINAKCFNNELPKYKIIWNKKYTVTIAEVYFESKRIEFSYKHFNELNGKKALLEAIDTIKHELLHIFQFWVQQKQEWNSWKCGHNDWFKKKAKEIGCKHENFGA